MNNIRILDIKHDSVVDGEGLRTVIFFAGCPHEPKCKNCHNPSSWNIENGKEMTVEEVLTEIKSNPLIQGVTFSGGEPFLQAKEILPLAIQIKLLGLDIWCYTGYTKDQIYSYPDISEKVRLLLLCDVLVDGKFIEEEKDLSLAFRGSKNQRILYRGKDY